MEFATRKRGLRVLTALILCSFFSSPAYGCTEIVNKFFAFLKNREHRAISKRSAARGVERSVIPDKEYDEVIPISEMSREALKALKRRGVQPKNGYGPPEVWSIDGARSAKRGYEGDFSELIQKMGGTPEDYFENLLKSNKARGDNTHVLDLFGSGFFVKNQDAADSVTGLRWGPYSKEIPRGYEDDIAPIPADYKGQEVLGDIANFNTWKKLDHSMKERDIPSVDLVTMRPVGGWDRAPWANSKEGNINALKYITGHVIQRLNKNGRFFFSVSIPQLKGDLKKHPKLLEFQEDIEKNTSFKLIVTTKISKKGKTYELTGALVPK